MRADRLDQLVIGPKEIDAETCRSMKTGSGPARDATAFGSMSTSVDRLAPSIGIDRSELAAATTANAARQEVGTTPSTRNVSSLSRLEL